MLSREQLYLDLLFSKQYISNSVKSMVDSSLILNNSPTAGSTLGFKHKLDFGLNRSGLLNPMTGRKFSLLPSQL
jgi:hypothetical protein